MTVSRAPRRRVTPIGHSSVVTRRRRPARPARRRGEAVHPETRDVVAAGSVLLLLLFVIKSYGVAHYSLTTTTALLVATPSQVALGTVTIYAYYVLPAVSLGTVWFAVRFRRRVTPPLWALVVVVAVVTALASPLTYLVRGLAVLLVAVWVELFLRRYVRRWAGSPDERLRRRRRALRRVQGLSIVYLGAAALAGLFLFSLDVPWVSAQAFQVTRPAVVSTNQDGAYRLETTNYFVGYVIAEDEEWVTVLHADTRYIMRIRQAEIGRRLSCHHEQDQLKGDRPLVEALQGRPYVSHNIDCRKVLSDLRARPLTAG